jgi:hypothetical protein
MHSDHAGGWKSPRETITAPGNAKPRPAGMEDKSWTSFHSMLGRT